MKTVKFFTLGCKVNQYDTQEIRERFLARGFRELDNGGRAGTYVINTCTVTGKADAESLSLIRRAVRENPAAKVIVTGCLTELDKDRIRCAFSRAVIVDNKDKGAILSGRQGVTSFCGHTRAFLKIQDGCDNFCSFCKVPLVRGRSKSKPLAQLKREAEALAANGFREIVITGICLGAYGKDLKPARTLCDAVSAVEGVNGVMRIRLSSIEAGDVSGGLIAKIASSAKLCRHLHIPIQSGDDTVLKKMNRRYNRKSYLALINKIKKRVPGIAITADVLVGFPGEGEAEFRNTLELVRKISPLKVHIFPYSKRQGTKAEGLSGAADPRIVKERAARLRSLSQKSSLVYKKRFLNKVLPVLFEERPKGRPGHWEGYTDNYMRVCICSSRNLANQLIPVKINTRNLL